MKDALADGLNHPMIVRLAAVRPSHANDDIIRLLLQETKLLEYISHIPRSYVTHMLLPSRIITALHRFYPEKFSVMFGADVTRLEAFWRGLMAR